MVNIISSCMIYQVFFNLLKFVKLPEEVCASHTKRVGDNKKVLQLK